MTHERLVEVYRAKDTPQAHVLRMALEDEGIPVFVEGDQLQQAVGALPTGWSIAPRLLVDEDDAARARALLKQWETHGPGGELADHDVSDDDA